MYMGTAMNNREKGSWLGVMIAANVVIPTAAQRRVLRNWRLFTTPTSMRNTSSSGNSNANPNAANISITSVRYLLASMSGRSEWPPTPRRNDRALVIVNHATTQPNKNNTIAE